MGRSLRGKGLPLPWEPVAAAPPPPLPRHLHIVLSSLCKAPALLPLPEDALIKARLLRAAGEHGPVCSDPTCHQTHIPSRQELIN